jgi:uncharacterized protein YbaA (DUF1428 family)
MKKGNYVDGYVLVVPKKNLDAYKKMASDAGKVWMKYGALDYKECVIDDAKPAHVTLPFGKMVSAKSNELVIFSYILYKSRAHRDTVNKKVMSDPIMNPEKWKGKPMPFDMKRMAFAGFNIIANY